MRSPSYRRRRGRWSRRRELGPPPDIESPAPPENLVLTPGDAEIEASWDNSPSEDVTGYEIRVSDDGGETWGLWTPVTSPTTLSSLTNDTEYTIEVRALDEVDNVSTSVSDTATPTEPIPGAIHILSLLETSGTVANDMGSDPIDGVYPSDADTILGDGTNGVRLVGNGPGDGHVLLPDNWFEVIGETEEWTFFLEFMPTQAGEGYSVFSCVTAGGQCEPMQCEFQSGNTLRVRFGSNDTQATITGTIALTLDAWNRIAVTCHRTGESSLPVSLWVNDVLDVELNGAGRGFNGRDGYLGSRNGTSGQGAATGRYRNCQIFDRYISDEERAAL